MEEKSEANIPTGSHHFVVSGGKIGIYDNMEMDNNFKQNVCLPYFKDLFHNLSVESGMKNKGISKFVFLKFIALPGFIGERLYNVIDKKKKGYIDGLGFVTSLFKLYSKDFNVRIKFIFDMFDFDDDGIITKDDVFTLLSHVSYSEQNNKKSPSEGKYEQVDEQTSIAISEKIKSELEEICSLAFKEGHQMTLKEFLELNEYENSDIFLSLYMALKKSIPSVDQFKNHKPNSHFSLVSQSPRSPAIKVLASPKVMSQFSPYHKMVSKFSSTNIEKVNKVQKGLQALRKFTVNKTVSQAVVAECKNSTLIPEENGMIESEKKNANFIAHRMPNSRFFNENVTQSPTDMIKEEDKEYLFCECGEIISDFDKVMCKKCLNQGRDEQVEGYLYKENNLGELVKFWVLLTKNELHFFSSSKNKDHKSLKALAGCHFSEEITKTINNKIYYRFKLFWQVKKSTFLVENAEEYHKWIEAIKKRIGYANISDFYNFDKEIGKGKFGVVKLAVHKKTSKKVAVKILEKLHMKKEEIELVFSEIEILKVCKHPNIIRLLDIFENAEYIYIVMDYFEGGDLFDYFQDRDFKLKETRVRDIMRQIVSAVSYLHGLGIVHRDLKPENILLVDKSENSRLKITDFGLSKIIGPNEKCAEEYGTLCYIAPEIIQQKLYGKAVDIWGLGLIAHLLLVGYIPFDDDERDEMARKIIFSDPQFTNIRWVTISEEAIDFVRLCLNKNPDKRPSIRQLSEHSWIQQSTLSFEDRNKPWTTGKLKSKNIPGFKVKINTENSSTEGERTNKNEQN